MLLLPKLSGTSASMIHAIGESNRSLLGFDLRETRSGRWPPATLDNNVWPTVLTESQYQECNGINLLNSIENALTGRSDSDAAIVAFDAPQARLEEIASTFGITVTDHAPPGDFHLLGYDIVDLRTQSSAFYSFDWSLREWMEFSMAQGLRLTKDGLLRDLHEAAEISSYFDRVIPEHAPFSSCGVYVLKR